MSAVITNTPLSAIYANFSGAQFALHAPPKNHPRSERHSARHDIGGRRHFAAARRKKPARVNGLEKIRSAIWFALDTRHGAAL
jgi:hypothetical protein